MRKGLHQDDRFPGRLAIYSAVLAAFTEPMSWPSAYLASSSTFFSPAVWRVAASY